MLILVVTLASCGNDNSKDGNNDKSNDDKVELEVWRVEDPDSPPYEIFTDMIEKFQDEHPDIIIKDDTTPHDDYKTRLNTQAAGGQLPDVFQVWPGAELEPLVKGDVVQELNDILDYWTEETRLLNEEDFENFAFEEKIYGVPSSDNPTHFVFYDEDILADVGYDSFPETYENFLNLIDDLNSADITPISLGNSEGWPLQSMYISTIADRFTGGDFLDDVTSGDRKFTDTEFIEALEVIDELTNEGAFNEDFNTIDTIQMIDYFVQGKTAMVIDGNWAAATIIPKLEDDKNIGVALLPLNDITSISTTTGDAMAIKSGLSEDKREAAETFLKYIYSEELYQRLMEAGRLVLGDVEMPEDSELHPLIEELMKVADVSDPAPVYDATLPPSVISVLENEIQSITVGSSTPEEAAENIQKEMESK